MTIPRRAEPSYFVPRQSLRVYIYMLNANGAKDRCELSSVSDDSRARKRGRDSFSVYTSFAPVVFSSPSLVISTLHRARECAIILPSLSSGSSVQSSQDFN